MRPATVRCYRFTPDLSSSKDPTRYFGLNEGLVDFLIEAAVYTPQLVDWQHLINKLHVEDSLFDSSELQKLRWAEDQYVDVLKGGSSWVLDWIIKEASNASRFK